MPKQRLWEARAHLDSSHGRRVQPIACSNFTFSEPTAAARYCPHAKVHSSSPPSAMAWQYTVDLRFGEMLKGQTKNKEKNKGRCDDYTVEKRVASSFRYNFI